MILKGGVIGRMDTEKMFLTDDGFNLVCEELAEEDLKTTICIYFCMIKYDCYYPNICFPICQVSNTL